ncbi:hypothetical protein SPHINGO391_500207 [Sphingomonas aurantiaca]|uniref:Uncharacterized protein n=1 Tax=Sphingomonas aurantiaca TaxID=185949 RepID=A0A5E8AAN2_9SPHN|nr:hypothetical protein SPHINGO391_500207 [Sphingomonas aurantiaca]
MLVEIGMVAALRDPASSDLAILRQFHLESDYPFRTGVQRGRGVIQLDGNQLRRRRCSSGGQQGECQNRLQHRRHLLLATVRYRKRYRPSMTALLNEYL